MLGINQKSFSLFVLTNVILAVLLICVVFDFMVRETAHFRPALMKNVTNWKEERNLDLVPHKVYLVPHKVYLDRRPGPTYSNATVILISASSL